MCGAREMWRDEKGEDRREGRIGAKRVPVVVIPRPLDFVLRRTASVQDSQRTVNIASLGRE